MDTSRTILVTGAAGFIGTRLLRALADQGREVVAVDRARGAARPGVRWIESDLGDAKPLLEPLAGRPFALVHLAWDTTRTPRYGTHADHVHRLAGLLDAWPERSAGRLVALGSAEELGGAGGVLDEGAEALSPFSPYGWGKRAARSLVHEWSGRSGAPAFWLRPFIVYGPGQRGDQVIPYAIERALSGGRGEFSAGYQRRDFVHVDDVVDAILRAIESPLTGWNEFHIGSGTKVAVREVVGEIADQLEARDRFVFGARAIKPGEPEIQVADVRRARAVLGWVPRIGWREGVRALCAEARVAAAPPRTPQGAPRGGAGGR